MSLITQIEDDSADFDNWLLSTLRLVPAQRVKGHPPQKDRIKGVVLDLHRTVSRLASCLGGNR